MRRLLIHSLFLPLVVMVLGMSPAQAQDKITKAITSALSANAGTQTPEPGKALSLEGLVGIDRASVRRVVLVAFNPNIGDNIVFEFGQIPLLHRLYPNAKVVVFSPTPGILQANDWLSTQTLPYEEFMQPGFVTEFVQDLGLIGKRLAAAVKPFVDSETLVLWDHYFFSMRMMSELSGAIRSHLTSEQATLITGTQYEAANWKNFTFGTGEGYGKIWMPARDEIFDRWLGMILAQDAIGVGYGFLGGPPLFLVATKKQIPGARLGDPFRDEGARAWFGAPGPFAMGHTPIYELAQQGFEYLFGSDARLEWPEKLYFDSPSQELEAAAFRKAAIGEGSYIVVNFNTKGDYKVRDLARDYAERVNELLSAARSIRPDLGILVSEPENVFGESVVADVRQTIERLQKLHPGKIAFLPQRKELWKPLIRDAAGVLSQDSGFYHIAAILNPETLNMGREIWGKLPNGKPNPIYVGEVYRWTRPNGRFALLAEVDGTPHPTIEAWLRVLKPNCRAWEGRP